MAYDASVLRVPAEPLRTEPGMFTWDAETGPDAGATGITGSAARARERLAEALAGAPVGSGGVVHRSQPSVSARGGYLHVETLARARVDESGLVWL